MTIPDPPPAVVAEDLRALADNCPFDTATRELLERAADLLDPEGDEDPGRARAERDAAISTRDQLAVRLGHVEAGKRTATEDGVRRPGQPVQWGAYEPAIRRWERILGRVAPSPTIVGKKGGQQLAPLFVEWLMGLPEGHVIGVPGLSRNEQLKLLGNGVVPQQAEAALRVLLADALGEVAA